MVTTSEVRQSFDGLDTVEFQNSQNANGIRVAVNEAEAGAFFKALRISELDFSSRRIGDTIIAHIEADSSGLLDDLFHS